MAEPAPNAWFPPRDPALLDFLAVQEAHSERLNAATLEVALRDPDLAPLVRAIPPEQRAAQGLESRARLHRAVESGDWTEYQTALIGQARLYAGRGLSFGAWHLIVRAWTHEIVPLLVDAYAAEPRRLAAALQAMQRLSDRAMALLGETYIDAKATALRLSEERLRLTLLSIGDAVISTDSSGRVEKMNQVAEGLTGWSSDEAVGRPLSEVFVLEDERTGAPASDPVGRVLREGVTVGLANHTALVRRDGIRTPIADSAAPIRDAAGAVTGVVLVFRDQSAERAAQRQAAESEELVRRNQRIQEASRLKSEFLANMSHELRTPLNSVLGFAELLHDGEVGPIQPRQKEFLGDILASGRHLLQLINDVLDLAKVESGKMEFHPEAVQLPALVAEVASILRTAASARGIEIEASIDPAVSDVVVDPARLKQVLYNYLSNAIKFTGPGSAVLVRAIPEGDDRVRIEVEDHGIGIGPEDLRKLFVEFQQLDGGAAKKHGGTGLGLALTRRLVEAQGGTVGVRSTPGQGSTFHAILPRRAGGIAPWIPRLAGDRPAILVVEDDPADQARIASALAQLGCVVRAVATGAQALAACREERFDAITLDLLLPDMTGLDVLGALRQDHRFDGVPIVVVTVVTERATAGFVVHDVLPKPIDRELLAGSLRRAGVLPGTGGAIVVVDDDPASLRLMEAALETMGLRAISFLDPVEALAATEGETPAAVIVDLVMPRLDGFEFLDRFRAIPSHRAVPVVVWTSRDLAPREWDGLRAAAQAVIRKGTGHSELVNALRTWFGPERR